MISCRVQGANTGGLESLRITLSHVLLVTWCKVDFGTWVGLNIFHYHYTMTMKFARVAIDRMRKS